MALAMSFDVHAATVRIRGEVIDSLTHEPVPYAAIFLEGTDRGELTNDNGHFDLSTALPFTALTVSVMGYSPKTLPRKYCLNRNLKIELVPTGVTLNELTVKPKREKYNKNNPAVRFMEKIKRGGEETDPRRNGHYNYDKYERINIALNNISADSSDMSVWVRKFPVLKEHIDTSELSGLPVLSVALREKSSHVDYRKDPKSEKEIVLGLRNEGIDGMLDPQAMQTLYEDVLREVDIYGNDITLMQNQFVSPLSRLAPDFYKFYLNDTVKVAGDSCIVLTFVPHNPRSFGFTGKIYVALGDTTMMPRRIEMNVPHDINLNYINNLRIIQEYRQAPDGSRLKVLDDMMIEAGFLAKRSELYARRVAAYEGHTFDPPADESIHNQMGKTITVPGADERDEAFWQSRRLIPIKKGENSVGNMLDRLRENKFFYWGEKIIKLLVTGYVNTGNPSKFDIGPLNTTISGNELEGVRLRVGGMTTGALSKRFFSKGYVAWGTRDHKWKYMAEVEYSFRDKKRHAREFPMHSLRATHLYDVDMLGQHYLFTNPDNVFLSIKRGKNQMMTYHRVSKLEYTLELENNFSLFATVKTDRQEPSRFIQFSNGFGDSFSHLTTTSISLTLRYAPGEKFFQTTTTRIPVNYDAPIIQLTHTFAPKGILGNRYALNVTELSFQKRFWFSAFGFTDVILRGGHVWSTSPYFNLLIPNANLSYTIQPESFPLMNAMEFVNDSYLSWDMTYWLNGALFNLIPGFSKLRLREVISFRGIWGHLSDKNNPSLNPDLIQFPGTENRVMTSTPYMEFGVGLDNILRILRLDYVWRLTYRNVPGACRSGLRLALHFTF